MKRFLYLQNPLNSKLDLKHPLLGKFIPRKASLIEHWAISSSFSHYNKYNSETDWGDLFMVIDIIGNYDQHIGDALMLSDKELYVTCCGQIRKMKDVKKTDPLIGKDTETFTHAIVNMQSPERIRNTDIEEKYISSALVKPMHSAILHEQFTISPLVKMEKPNKLIVVRIKPELSPEIVYKRLKKYHKNPSENISNAIRDYENLSLIPYASPLKILGYVSILERLVTDDSKNNVVSISQQFSNKLVLINNRLGEHQLEFGQWFNPSTSDQTILLKIYNLRSKIAHGSDTDFEDNKIKELKSKEHVHQFLNSLVKRAIFFSVCEPSLMNDLKAC